MSASKYITLSSSIPIYNSLLDHIESLLDESDKKLVDINVIYSYHMLYLCGRLYAIDVTRIDKFWIG